MKQRLTDLPFEEMLDRVALMVMALAGTLLLGIWLSLMAKNMLTTLNAWALPIGAVVIWSCALAGLHQRRQRQHRFAVVGTMSVVVFLPLLTGAGLLTQTPGRELVALSCSVIWIPLTYILVFFLVEQKLALRLSLGLYALYALCLIVPAWGILPVSSRVEISNTLIVSMIAQPMYIALLLGYSDLKKRHTRITHRALTMEYAADTDGLTRLFNRRRLMRDIDQIILSDQASPQKKKLAVILMDIDHFKSVNDIHGHQVGDEVLVHLAKVLQKHVRNGELAARWGGEEFMVALRVVHVSVAAEVAERLRAAIQGTAWPRGLRITASMGVAQIRPGESVDDLIHRADLALYTSKKLGRNQVSLFHDAMAKAEADALAEAGEAAKARQDEEDAWMAS
ncbi:diguanylate cyclase [Amphibiibacter pelophylacis]|uniref:GGDEF domain-containing protein n=1 Tax=Amphibiibacter pelophylacis TaxID=1799477 RepID=A0ACC6NYB5_9BURK